MFRHRHASTALALALALAAAAPSAASARYATDPPPATSHTQAPPTVDLRSPDARDAADRAVRAIQAQGARAAHELAARGSAVGSATPSSPPHVIITASQPNGFAWGDAGIGGAAMFGLILVLLGTTLYLSHRRTAQDG
jgi:hypothetical protein